MIQRIQTFHLMVVTIIMATACFIPIASFVAGGNECMLKAFRIYSSGSGETLLSTPMMGILYTISTILPFSVIFMYRKRMLQVRLCIVEIVLLLGCIGYAIAYFHLMSETAEEFSVYASSIRIGSIVPAVAIILVILAIRGILKDELLVRSLNRIR